jgi:hypothetical protein
MANSRPFMDWLREQRGGHTHDELSDALQELVAAVTSEGKAGTLVFTIKVAPAGKSDALEVTDRIVVKGPPQTRSASLWFPTPENNLIREDPKQMTLELREIPAGVHKALA